jgi:hypothetical protein
LCKPLKEPRTEIASADVKVVRDVKIIKRLRQIPFLLLPVYIVQKEII